MSNNINPIKLNIKTLGHFKNNYDSLFFYKNTFMYNFLVNGKIEKLSDATDFINKSSIIFNTRLIFNNNIDSSDFKFYISDNPIINVKSEIEKDLIIKKEHGSNIDLIFSNTEFFIFNNSIEIDYSKNMSSFIKSKNTNDFKGEVNAFFGFQKSSYNNKQGDLSDTLGFFIKSLSYYDLKFILGYYFSNKKQVTSESDIKQAIQNQFKNIKNKKIFTIKFFSLFDNTDNTYIKRKFFTETKLSILQDNISLNESRSKIKDSIKLIDQTKINNLTYYYDLPGDQKNTLENESSGLDIINSIQDIDEVININLKYFLIIKVYADEEKEDNDIDLKKIKKQQYDDFIQTNDNRIYFYDPEIYFINVNNKPYKLKDKILSSSSIKDNDFLSQYFIEKVMTFSIKTSDIIDKSNISSNSSLINLNNFYKKSFIYFDSQNIYNDLNITKPEFNSSFSTSKIPTFIQDQTYNLYEDYTDENRSFLPLPKANSIKRGRERFADVRQPSSKEKVYASPLNKSKPKSEDSFRQVKNTRKKDVKEEEVLKVYGKDQNKTKAIQEITKYSQKSNQRKNNNQRNKKETNQTDGYIVYKRNPDVRTRNDKNEVKRAEPWKGLVKGAAEMYYLPEALLWAFMKYESDFISTAKSPKGAQGLMQLMPFTAKDMGVTDQDDPAQNIFGAAKLINIHKTNFNDNLVQMLSAYHAGGGGTRKAITSYKKQNPGADASNIIFSSQKTKLYVDTVLKYYYHYLQNPLFDDPINNDNEHTLKEIKIETQQNKENSNNKEDEIKNKKSKLKSSNLRREELERLKREGERIKSSSPLPPLPASQKVKLPPLPPLPTLQNSDLPPLPTKN
jgi:soluble lytic murein transglycosylase-like protein